MGPSDYMPAGLLSPLVVSEPGRIEDPPWRPRRGKSQSPELSLDLGRGAQLLAPAQDKAGALTQGEQGLCLVNTGSSHIGNLVPSASVLRGRTLAEPHFVD